MSEEKIRQAGPFRFVNRTKYNGDDIEAIFNLWRAAAKNQTGRPETEPSRHRHGHPVDVFDISDYKPARVFVTQREWQPGSNRSVEVVRPEYLNGPGYAASTSWKLSIVEPSRLFQSEVEALSHGPEFAPAELSVQLAKLFMRMFSEIEGLSSAGTYQAMKDTVIEQAGQIKIRIESKRENAATNSDRKMRVVRSRAANATNALIYSGGDAARHLEVFRRQLKNYMPDFVATKVDTDFTVAEADALIRDLAGLICRIENYKQELIG
jgi:hypothetical protein